MLLVLVLPPLPPPPRVLNIFSSKGVAVRRGITPTPIPNGVAALTFAECGWSATTKTSRRPSMPISGIP
ncbi:hypothetical protein HanRHA438_Chr14g0640481 [Helianthus annuus]|nr:hypothetical protein HanRHA438_Chr14g0640481 [Helianthus annuus]